MFLENYLTIYHADLNYSTTSSDVSPQDEFEITDVLIYGAGPIGAMLSAYLGKLGVSNIALEK